MGLTLLLSPPPELPSGYARLLPEQARERFATARVARLATITPAGDPHVIPITYAPDGVDTLISAVDHKPKTTMALARLTNISAHPAVSLLVDGYAEDWSTLWWARADGHARILDARDPAEREDAARRLADRYPQYLGRVPAGPVIVITVTRWSGWSAV